VTEHFAQSNNCPIARAASFSCTINLVFTPYSFGGSRRGVLSPQGSGQSANCEPHRQRRGARTACRRSFDVARTDPAKLGAVRET
jgi:hypothetical protein